MTHDCRRRKSNSSVPNQSLSDQTDRSFGGRETATETALGSLLFEVGRVSDAARLRKSAAAAYKSLIFDAGYESETYLVPLDGYATALAWATSVRLSKSSTKPSLWRIYASNRTTHATTGMAALMRLGRCCGCKAIHRILPACARDLQGALARWDVLTPTATGPVPIGQAKLTLADSLISNGELDDATTYLSEAYVALTVVDTYQSFIWKADLVSGRTGHEESFGSRPCNWQRSRDLVSAIELQESIVIINRDSEVQAKRLDNRRQRRPTAASG